MQKKYKLLSIIFSTLFVLLAILVKFDLLTTFDTFVYEMIIQFQSDRLTFFFRQITRFGNGEIVIAIALLFLLIRKKLAIFCLINIICNHLLNNGLKFLMMRVRPNILRLIEIGGYSFPSGHAMISMAFYGLLIYFVHRLKYFKNIKILLYCVFVLIILLVGISRIYLGVHYASDVIGGYLASLAYLFVLISTIEKYDLLNQ